MPAYEYACEACGNRFERRQKMSEPESAACPECGAEARRLISGGAGIIAKSGQSSRPACMSGEACHGPEMGCGGACGCGH